MGIYWLIVAAISVGGRVCEIVRGQYTSIVTDLIRQQL